MASEIKVDTIVNAGGDNDSGIDLATNDTVKVTIAGAEKARVNSDGKLLVGKTSAGDFVTGFEVQPAGAIVSYRSSGVAGLFGRTDDGEILRFNTNSATTGKIGSSGGDDLFILATSGAGMLLQGSAVLPANSSGASVDDDRDLGSSSKRWRDIYTNGAVTTSSDQNEKQDIANLSAKELKVANKLSALFKTYRWKDRVAEKGDKARTHSGIIAQDIQSAFSAEGLDASNYGMFISNTWTDEEGKEKTRLAVRYTELFSFIFSSIEARLTALESK